MITFAVEDWFAVRDEMSHLWPAHWEEVAVNRDTIPLELDMESYDRYAMCGALHIVVARAGGEVVGYHASIVRPHLHYRSSLSAFTDVYYIAPAHRTGRTPLRLFQFVEKTLKERGVQRMFTGTKKSLDIGNLFEHMGWTEFERHYVKTLR
ncbi:GNAT family N-acetyltransferase [Pseudacidovorax intermedius]|uniref:GNAT family N-acetyltransferase n=1 Tax=Pseudacidovorax intermedius TaxID=433924 RepID=UPI000347742F|nr:GNAT family N-acetyltransferase [Pseudacidovorax intermedius]